jgi:hypothetical protein
VLLVNGAARVATPEMHLALELGRTVVDALRDEPPLLGAHVLELVCTLGRSRVVLSSQTCPQGFQSHDRGSQSEQRRAFALRADLGAPEVGQQAPSRRALQQPELE